MLFAMELFIDTLYRFKEVPYITSFLRIILKHECVLNFIKCFSVSV